MGKDLSEIEDDYKTAYEDLIDKYREELKLRKDGDKYRKGFHRQFNKILHRRNKAYSEYVKKHGTELLSMPEKKIKKDIDKGVYHAYHVEFKKTFLERMKMRSDSFCFNLLLHAKSVKYNIIPSWLKFFAFRVGLFFRSIFSDVSLFFRGIRLDISRVFRRYFSRLKDSVMVIVNKIKDRINIIKEWNKRRIEAKKKKKEEKEQKKKEAEEAKKKTEENVDEEENDNENVESPEKTKKVEPSA